MTDPNNCAAGDRRVSSAGDPGYLAWMPLLLGCFAVIFPRLVLFLVWLLGGGWLERAVTNALLLVLGFLLMPLTTLAYAYAYHSWSSGGSISLIGWAIVALAVLVDVGGLRKGHHGYTRRRERD